MVARVPLPLTPGLPPSLTHTDTLVCSTLRVHNAKAAAPSSSFNVRHRQKNPAAACSQSSSDSDLGGGSFVAARACLLLCSQFTIAPARTECVCPLLINPSQHRS